MAEQITQLRIDGLTALQLLELRAAVAGSARDCITVVDSPKLTGGKLGEPVLLSAILKSGTIGDSRRCSLAREAKEKAQQKTQVHEDQR